MKAGLSDIGRWRGFDPRDDDWICIKCNALFSTGSRCERCEMDRVYDDEELKKIETSDRSGELIYEEVILGESAVTDEDIESKAECARQWSLSVVQFLRVNGILYVLIAVKGPDAHHGADADFQKNGIEMILVKCKPNPQTYSFSTPQSLDSITKAVMKQRFNVECSSTPLGGRSDQ